MGQVFITVVDNDGSAVVLNQYEAKIDEITKQNSELVDALKEQNEELKRRLELLEIENEYLKKLAALVQKRKAQQQKKK